MNDNSLLKKVSAAILAVTMAFTVFAGTGIKVHADPGGIRDFVTRLYVNILGRNPDQIGIDDWCNRMANGLTAAECSVGFFHSNEFIGMNLSDEEYVRILYNTILGREPDQTGWNDWCNRLATGASRDSLLAGFVESQEFTQICESYGVTRGSLSGAAQDEPGDVRFVRRTYQVILGRTPDQGGLDNWVNALRGGGVTAAAMVQGFYNSQEFINKNTTNEEYVESLYRSMLSRASDANGKRGWVDLLDNAGVSRDYVLNGFIGSQEFIGLCNSYGISRGAIALTEERDQHPDLNRFIVNAYRAVTGSQISGSDLNTISGQAAGGTTGETILDGYFSTNAFRSMTDAQKVTAVYQAALGRTPSSSEATSAASTLSSGGLSALTENIYSSQEFGTYCSGFGIISSHHTGIFNINGKLYYNNGSGYQSGWQRINGNRYYFDPEDGNAAAIGWKNIGGLRYYFNTDGTLCQDVDSIIGTQSSYYVTVNRTTNTVMIYARSTPGGAFDTPVKAMVCSVGIPSRPTITGNYTLHQQSRWGLMFGNVYAQYVTRINGNYLFHSVPYYDNGDIYSLQVDEFNMLGQPASHGCVRLSVSDAKWIYEHCEGSTVHIFSSDESAPFDRPSPYPASVVNGNRGYDPRDPAITGSN